MSRFCKLDRTGTLPFPTFNGYSPSTPAGGLTAAVVYANYGTREDFEAVARAGVDVRGCICIVRYGALFRGAATILFLVWRVCCRALSCRRHVLAGGGLPGVRCRRRRGGAGSKTENANNAGCVGVLIYSDPLDYAKEGVEPENTFPNTRYLPATGVQRGSLFAAAGDPLTPGALAQSEPPKPASQRLQASQRTSEPEREEDRDGRLLVPASAAGRKACRTVVGR